MFDFAEGRNINFLHPLYTAEPDQLKNGIWCVLLQANKITVFQTVVISFVQGLQDLPKKKPFVDIFNPCSLKSMTIHHFQAFAMEGEEKTK